MWTNIGHSWSLDYTGPYCIGELVYSFQNESICISVSVQRTLHKDWRSGVLLRVGLYNTYIRRRFVLKEGKSYPTKKQAILDAISDIDSYKKYFPDSPSFYKSYNNFLDKYRPKQLDLF